MYVFFGVEYDGNVKKLIFDRKSCFLCKTHFCKLPKTTRPPSDFQEVQNQKIIDVGVWCRPKKHLCQNDHEIMPDTLKNTRVKMEVRIKSYDNLKNICGNFVQILGYFARPESILYILYIQG